METALEQARRIKARLATERAAEDARQAAAAEEQAAADRRHAADAERFGLKLFQAVAAALVQERKAR